MNALVQWFRNKFGRIVTGAGFLLTSVEGFDISAIKDPLEGILGHIWVLRITVGLFLLSWFRHQYTASKVQ